MSTWINLRRIRSFWSSWSDFQLFSQEERDLGIYQVVYHVFSSSLKSCQDYDRMSLSIQRSDASGCVLSVCQNKFDLQLDCTAKFITKTEE